MIDLKTKKSVTFEHVVKIYGRDNELLGELVANDTSVITGEPMAWGFNPADQQLSEDELVIIAEKLKELNRAGGGVMPYVPYCPCCRDYESSEAHKVCPLGAANKRIAELESKVKEQENAIAVYRNNVVDRLMAYKG